MSWSASFEASIIDSALEPAGILGEEFEVVHRKAEFKSAQSDLCNGTPLVAPSVVGCKTG